MYEITGWTGSMLLAFSAMPQMMHAIRNKHAKGLSWGFLGMWGAGMTMCLTYILHQKELQYPLVANYVLNLSMWTVIFFYKITGHLRKS